MPGFLGYTDKTLPIEFCISLGLYIVTECRSLHGIQRFNVQEKNGSDLHGRDRSQSGDRGKLKPTQLYSLTSCTEDLTIS